MSRLAVGGLDRRLHTAGIGLVGWGIGTLTEVQDKLCCMCR